MGTDDFLFTGQPAIPRVVFSLHRHPSHRIIRTPFPLTPSQVKRLLQRGELPVDRGRLHAIGIALILIRHNALGRHMIQRRIAEESLQMSSRWSAPE